MSGRIVPTRAGPYNDVMAQGRRRVLGVRLSYALSG